MTYLYPEALANLPAPPEVRAAADDLMDALSYSPAAYDDLARVLGSIRQQIRSGRPDRAAELAECLIGLCEAAEEREVIRG